MQLHCFTQHKSSVITPKQKY